jgi:hypothetical protein
MINSDDDEIDENSSEFNELLKKKQIHPTGNKNTKWDLVTLFKPVLVSHLVFFLKLGYHISKFTLFLNK